MDDWALTKTGDFVPGFLVVLDHRLIAYELYKFRPLTLPRSPLIPFPILIRPGRNPIASAALMPQYKVQSALLDMVAEGVKC